MEWTTRIDRDYPFWPVTFIETRSKENAYLNLIIACIGYDLSRISFSSSIKNLTRKSFLYDFEFFVKEGHGREFFNPEWKNLSKEYVANVIGRKRSFIVMFNDLRSSKSIFINSIDALDNEGETDIYIWERQSGKLIFRY